MFTSIGATRVSEHAYRQVLRLLENGQLKPGDRLPSERELVEKLGVSRNSVREALRMLETAGIVKVTQGRATYITSTARVSGPQDFWARWLTANQSQVLDLLDLREALELKCVAWAAQRATAADIERIVAAHAALLLLVDSGEAEAMAQADLEFHAAIGAAVHNPLFVSLVPGILEALHHSRVAIFGLAGRATESCREHAAIVRAIEAADPEAATQAMQQHMQSTRATVATLNER